MRKLLALCCMSTLLNVTLEAKADQWTDFGSITLVSAGWVEDTIAVMHSASFKTDSAACNNAAIGYATSPMIQGTSCFKRLS